MGSKKESTFVNMVGALLVVTLISSAILGYMYELTKEPISQAKLNKKLTAIKEVVPEFNNNPDSAKFEIPVEGGEPVIAYPAEMNGKLVGVAIETYTNKGFSGLVKVMVGFEPDGTIYNYQVLEHKETPGLGTHMADWFKPSSGGETKERSAFADWLFGIKQSSGGDSKSVVGKNPGKVNMTVSKDGGDIDAITAATISSRAFLDAINRGYNSFMSYYSKKESEATNE
jgi:electron transport complex protein RnfG